MLNKISIIGLGWLGLPLYKKLSSMGYACIGSTTTNDKKEKLKNEGFYVEQVMFTETSVLGDIENCLQGSDILVLNTPPGLRRNPDSNYVAKIEHLVNSIEKSSIKKVLYISSTSVFKDEEHFPEITNKTAPNATSNAGIQIKKVEELLTGNLNFETTILRFSGLVDNERHPATMMSKRPNVNNPKAPVNLIHKEDCLGIITTVINSNLWGQIYNASYPTNLTKKEYYDTVCKKRGLSVPNFNNSITSKGKLIDGNDTSKDLNYTYDYVV